MINIISYLRHRNGMTMSDLSKATDLTDMDISRMERGNLKCEIDKFLAIASFFKVPIGPLVNNQPEKVIKHLLNDPSQSLEVSEKRMSGERSKIKTGDLGEEIALEYEISRHINAGSPYVDLIDPTCSLKRSNGFDIMSRTLDGKKLMIEVKASTGGLESRFYLTAHELRRAQEAAEDGDVYMIYRVIFTNDPERYEVIPLTSEELYSQFKMAAETYSFVPNGGC